MVKVGVRMNDFALSNLGGFADSCDRMATSKLHVNPADIAEAEKDDWAK